MAVQAGVVMRNGDPVPDGLQRLFRERVGEFAVDYLHEVRGPGYFVLHGVRSWAGPKESWREAPGTHMGHHVFFDGRLDNRDELTLRYFSQRERLGTISDADIIGRAIAVGGTTSLVGALGDWSAALIATTDRTVLLSSDGMGVRPLYYANLSFGVVWSTDLAIATTAACTRSSNLDPAFFAGFIVGLPPPLSTPFDGVFAVRPGATLTIDARGKESEEIWWAPWGVPLREEHREDTALELLTVWRRVVKDRLPESAVLLELSGGFDSSSIVSMASCLQPTDSCGSTVHTVTRVSPNEPGWNDLRFVKAVADRCHFVSHYLDLSRLPSGRDISTPAPDGPHGVDLANEVLMEKIDARTLVSGRYGDLLMQSPTLCSSVVTASLCAGRVRDVFRDATAVARAVRQSAWRVLRDACQPFSPRYTGESLLLDLYHRNAGYPATAADLVRTALAEQVRQRWRDIHRSCRRPAPARRQLALKLARMTHVRRFEPPPSQGHLFHTHPFLDRRLVSFVMERQPQVISGAGQSRMLMKQAFQQILPEEVLARRSKGNYSPILQRQFHSTAHALLRIKQLALAELGVVEPEIVREALRRCLEPATGTPGPLVTLAYAEFWLRRVMFNEFASPHAIDRTSAKRFTTEALLSGAAIQRETTF